MQRSQGILPPSGPVAPNTFKLFPAQRPFTPNLTGLPSPTPRAGAPLGRSRRSLSLDSSRRSKMLPTPGQIQTHTSTPHSLKASPTAPSADPEPREPISIDTRRPGRLTSQPETPLQSSSSSGTPETQSQSQSQSQSRVQQVQKLLAQQRNAIDQAAVRPDLRFSPSNGSASTESRMSPPDRLHGAGSQAPGRHAPTQLPRPVGPAMQAPRRPSSPLRRQDSPASATSLRDPIGLGLSFGSNVSTPDLAMFPVPGYAAHSSRPHSPHQYPPPRPHSPHGLSLARPHSPHSGSMLRPSSPQRQYGIPPQNNAAQYQPPPRYYQAAQPQSPGRADSPIYTPPGLSAKRKVDHNLRVDTTVSSPQRTPQPSIQQMRQEQMQQQSREASKQQDAPSGTDSSQLAQTSGSPPTQKRAVRKSTLQKPLPAPPPPEALIPPAPELSDASRESSRHESPSSTPPPLSPISPVSPLSSSIARPPHSPQDFSSSGPRKAASVGSPVSAITTLDSELAAQVPYDAPSVPPIPKTLSRKPVPVKTPTSTSPTSPLTPPSSRYQVKVNSPSRKADEEEIMFPQPPTIQKLDSPEATRTLGSSSTSAPVSQSTSPQPAESPVRVEKARSIVIQPLEKPVIESGVQSHRKAPSVALAPSLITLSEQPQLQLDTKPRVVQVRASAHNAASTALPSPPPPPEPTSAGSDAQKPLSAASVPSLFTLAEQPEESDIKAALAKDVPRPDSDAIGGSTSLLLSKQPRLADIENELKQEDAEKQANETPLSPFERLRQAQQSLKQSAELAQGASSPRRPLAESIADSGTTSRRPTIESTTESNTASRRPTMESKVEVASTNRRPTIENPASPMSRRPTTENEANTAPAGRRPTIDGENKHGARSRRPTIESTADSTISAGRTTLGSEVDLPMPKSNLSAKGKDAVSSTTRSMPAGHSDTTERPSQPVIPAVAPLTPPPPMTVLKPAQSPRQQPVLTAHALPRPDILLGQPRSGKMPSYKSFFMQQEVVAEPLIPTYRPSMDQVAPPKGLTSEKKPESIRSTDTQESSSKEAAVNSKPSLLRLADTQVVPEKNEVLIRTDPRDAGTKPIPQPSTQAEDVDPQHGVIAASSPRPRVPQQSVPLTTAHGSTTNTEGTGARAVRSQLVSGSPPSTQQPSTQQPSTQQPSTQQPSTQQPSTQQPSTQQPSTQQPSTQQPSTQQSSTQQASTQQASTQQPSLQDEQQQRVSADRAQIAGQFTRLANRSSAGLSSHPPGPEDQASRYPKAQHNAHSSQSSLEQTTRRDVSLSAFPIPQTIARRESPQQAQTLVGNPAVKYSEQTAAATIQQAHGRQDVSLPTASSTQPSHTKASAVGRAPTEQSQQRASPTLTPPQLSQQRNSPSSTPPQQTTPPCGPRADHIDVLPIERAQKPRPTSDMPPPVPRKDTVKAVAKRAMNPKGHQPRMESDSSIQPEPRGLSDIQTRGDSQGSSQSSNPQSDSALTSNADLNRNSSEKSSSSTSIEAIRARVAGITSRTAKAVEPPSKDEGTLLAVLDDLSKQSEALHDRYLGMRTERQKLTASITTSLKENKAGPQYANTMLDQHMALAAIISSMDICFAKLKSIDCRKEEAITTLMSQLRRKASSASTRTKSEPKVKQAPSGAPREQHDVAKDKSVPIIRKPQIDRVPVARKPAESKAVSTTDSKNGATTMPQQQDDTTKSEPQVATSTQAHPRIEVSAEADNEPAVMSSPKPARVKGAKAVQVLGMMNSDGEAVEKDITLPDNVDASENRLMVRLGSSQKAKTPPPQRPLPAPPAKRKSPTDSIQASVLSVEDQDLWTPQEDATLPNALKSTSGKDVRVYEDDFLDYYRTAP